MKASVAPLVGVLIDVIVLVTMITTTPTESTTPVVTPIAPNVLVTLDARGRVRVSKEQRRAILAEFERSGVSAAQFAKVTGLKYSTLAGFRPTIRRNMAALNPNCPVCNSHR